MRRRNACASANRSLVCISPLRHSGDPMKAIAKKFLTVSLLATLGFGASSLFASGRAVALGGESLTCSVNHGIETNDCLPSFPSSIYDAEFIVSGGSGTYTYTWNITAPMTVSIVTGCTSTDSFCLITTNGTARDQVAQVSVTLIQNGQQSVISAVAEFPATCGSEFC